MRSIFLCVMLLAVTSSVFSVVERDRLNEEKGKALETNQTDNQIEIKEDRFSGVVTVTLKPQVISDQEDHRITIDIKTKLGEKGLSDFEKDDMKAEIWFRSQSKGSIDFGDQELHFLIDGKSLDKGEIPGGPNVYADERTLKPGFKISESFVSILNRSDLEQFSKARSIEMRLGSIELKLGQDVVTILGEYSKQVIARHKVLRERKQ
jgi:hypothetical protein